MQKRRTKDRHHRKCKSLGGNGKPRNISRVSIVRHRAYHALFNNMNPHEVARELSNVWIDPDFILIAMRREK